MKNPKRKRRTITAIYVGSPASSRRANAGFRKQVIDCWNFSDERGWKVAKIFVDLAQRSNLMNRTNFQKMLYEAKIGKFDVIVFCRLENLCSSSSDLADVTQLLRQSGISFHNLGT